jgi:hypothetical protein
MPINPVKNNDFHPFFESPENPCVAGSIPALTTLFFVSHLLTNVANH